MAVQSMNTRAPGRARHRDALHALNDAAESVLGTLQVWRRRIRERQQLTKLDDRMLQDIGISRAEAQYLGGKPFWRE